jgi:hypothetical protein
MFGEGKAFIDQHNQKAWSCELKNLYHCSIYHFFFSSDLLLQSKTPELL